VGATDGLAPKKPPWLVTPELFDCDLFLKGRSHIRAIFSAKWSGSIQQSIFSLTAAGVLP
jgi:hypothetical protein